MAQDSRAQATSQGQFDRLECRVAAPSRRASPRIEWQSCVVDEIGQGPALRPATVGVLHEPLVVLAVKLRIVDREIVIPAQLARPPAA